MAIAGLISIVAAAIAITFSLDLPVLYNLAWTLLDLPVVGHIIDMVAPAGWGWSLLGLVIAALQAVTGALLLAAALGLLTRAAWAWQVAIVALAGYMIAAIVGLLIAFVFLYGVSTTILLRTGITVAVCGVLLLYLTRPNVRGSLPR